MRASEAKLQDTLSLNTDFSDALVRGLSSKHKSIPSRFFYDARGSALFEDITKQPEYYPTRIETEILASHGDEIAEALKSTQAIIEFGSGSSTKTEILLRHMEHLEAYVAIDVSPTALRDAKQRLQKNFPHLEIETIVADFTRHVKLTVRRREQRTAGFFPGSTIGNFMPNAAITLLQTFASTLGETGHLVVGIDLKKSTDVLNKAYNDARGVTAEFNLNLLQRANQEAGADFDLASFQHRAAYDPATGGVDMYLVSTKAQDVSIDGETVAFAKDEAIHTEHAHKYSVGEFQMVAQKGGWSLKNVWTDDAHMFALCDLVRA